MPLLFAEFYQNFVKWSRPNEKISRSAAIGWIALVGLSIRCAERELGDVPQDTTLYDRNTSIFLWTD